ncbi:MAG: hypothetical protein JNK02_03535 [Planctomycetes bacterium]|nr:hypothetical protein [Planctomycetota bacterium]
MQHLGLVGAVAILATGALAQTTTPEIEPNETKAQATTNGIVVMVAGDKLTGTTTGSSTVTPGAASADTWHVKTGPLAPGIYRHTLAITTIGTAGHTGSIRGLNQTDPGGALPSVIGTTDTAFQSSSTTTAIPRSNSWYGFGRGEELYYRVTGTASTTLAYEATLSTAPIAPVVVPGTFAPGVITFSTVGQTTVDTDIHLFDGNLVVVDDASNDDESVAEGGTGATLQSQLRRTLTAGTYYLAIGRFNTATNDNTPGTDDFGTGAVLDFPDMIACSSTTQAAAPGADYDVLITDTAGSVPVVVLGPVAEPFSIMFVRITVGSPAPPITAFCFGDGTGAACPCGNVGAAGNGCASSVNPSGANLAGSGVASISADTLVLTGTGMPNSSALYFQGTSQAGGGLGVVFGDGLRCAGGSIIRLGTKNNVAGTSQYPAVGDTSISVRGLNVAGNVRTYQCWYRNAAAFCTPDTFNLTNGLQTTWAP